MAATGASIVLTSPTPNAGTTKGAHTGTSKGGIYFTPDSTLHNLC